MQQRLIIFTRYPEPGKTKTRMIPLLGPEGAAKLHRQLTEETLKVVTQVDLDSLSVAIYFTGGNLTLMRQWLGDKWDYYRQSEGDLGEKLQSALQDTYREAIAKVVIIGVDCPDLTSAILLEAFEGLNQSDVVIGRAVDGGYYLIGLSRLLPELFDNIDWGSERVFKQTQNIAQGLNLEVSYLSTLRDVDRPEDLDLIHNLL
ncbi:TIGR04282 family arsenosugar biosynthesis glycosyltransferase [Gloeocapsa sp. PCC 73106]|uniref:TIGR04282 family arsenosugar biosynthesis glycosyltransferase n=1 Tax=Gloeocapsa sp. PCC 73106 TaxID=102232 RepID=UPI0002AC634A|nr:TIGR04282 family arsenosugar biosynthesis glycosyltransferase [Gloeocapsa sp. PCC 73106]ELR96793.1 hypothetical protein GLO73106DRAFT_00005920 [Gloeocapsa sp. PCC 73106]